MTDTYLIWKLISLLNFIYIAFVCKRKTGQLTMVCNIYANIFAGIQKPIDKHTFHTNIVPRFDFLDSTTFVFCHLRYFFENEFNIKHI